jgi:hypothetical protein
MNRPIFITLLSSILAVAMSTPAPAQVDPASLVQQHTEAIARGDAAAALALYNDDAVLQVGALCTTTPCVGKAAIQKELERRVATKDHPTIIGKYVSGNVGTFLFELRNDTFQKAGVDRIITWSIYEVKGDKIAGAVGVPDRADPQTARYLEWQRAQPAAR